IDRVDVAASQAFVILFVRVRLFDAIHLAQLRSLLSVAGHECHQFRILLGIGKRRQNGRLSDMPQPHDGVTNLLLAGLDRFAVEDRHGNTFPPGMGCSSAVARTPLETWMEAWRPLSALGSPPRDANAEALTGGAEQLECRGDESR